MRYTRSSPFKDFNEFEKQIKEQVTNISFTDTGDTNVEYWTEAYLAAPLVCASDRLVRAGLLPSIAEIHTAARESGEAVASTLAVSLTEGILNAAAAVWRIHLADRVGAIRNQIRMALAPEVVLVITDSQGSTYRFGDVSELLKSMNLRDGLSAVSVEWAYGKAVLSRSDLLRDLAITIEPVAIGKPRSQ